MSLSKISIENAVYTGIENSIKVCVLDAIRSLSNTYGFDYDEAVNNLDVGKVEIVSNTKPPTPIKTTQTKTTSVKTEKVKKPEIELPFCGSKIEGFCSAIKKSNGLYNQCMKSTKKTYCSICQKQADKNSTNKPNLGDISDRIEQGDDWSDPTGKKPVKYAKVMEKCNISKEMAIEVAKSFGIEIPESEFVLDKTKKGRPKKSVSTEDTDDEKDKKKRGRPVKDKEQEEKTPGDDLIASLIEEAKLEETVEKVGKKKSSKKKSSKKKSNKKKSSKKKSSKKEVEPEIPEVVNHSELEEEDEIEVVKKEIDGKTYLLDQNNVIYDENQNELGTYNKETDTIIYFDNDEEEV